MQPNPFPGMNPYLEDLQLWAGFHSLFISALAGIINLWERLPKVWVPLGGEDPDIVLDSQAVLERVFQEGAYSRRLDYRKNLAVELPDSSRRWLESFLAERLPHKQDKTE